MSANKPARPKKAGSPVFPRQKPKLRLLNPKSECSTTDLIIELPQNVLEMLRGQKRPDEAVTDSDAPEAA
jgi:hypothetical protein